MCDSYYDDLLENAPLENCPNCGRGYDEIDFDFQCCSKCGWDAEESTIEPEVIRSPSDMDNMNGGADILTGEWI